MLDITTIILTYNEEIHIARCLENVCQFSKKVIIVDSPSTDRTREIAENFNKCNQGVGPLDYTQVEVVEHKYPGNQAEQFNWALDNLDIQTEWVLRMDADEYCTPELISEMSTKLPSLAEDVSAVVLPLGRAFMGRRLRHGIVNGVKMIRLFRYGCVRYEQRLMDEHLEVLKGTTVTFDHHFVDDNRLSIRVFVDKHNNYSSREAAMLVDAEYSLAEHQDGGSDSYAEEVARKRAQKAKYAKMPLFWRSFGYFVYRYIVKLGFLDGKEGFCWDFFQGLWYRMLVDGKVYDVRRFVKSEHINPESPDGKLALKKYIKDNWGIQL